MTTQTLDRVANSKTVRRFDSPHTLSRPTQVKRRRFDKSTKSPPKANPTSAKKKSSGKQRISGDEAKRLRRIQQMPLKKARQVNSPSTSELKSTDPRPHADAYFSLQHFFVYVGYVVAIISVIVFGLDLMTGIPFWRASIVFDVTSVICGLGLGYLSWNAHRDL